mgnify:FL=1|jgi:hypothetical protein|tara:strand:+ start:1595 stop:1831 length:237 start_codon:yes stop_codon:yes gene_type:complete
MTNYILKLKEEECMGLIELLELFRKEDEDENTVELRHKIKTQFQTQFDEIKKTENVTKEDVLKNAATIMGPSFCETCD